MVASAADFDRWELDPAAFAREALGVDLWPKQIEILEAIQTHRRVAVASCNSSGKTFVASVAAVHAMMTHPDSIVVTTAPGGRQAQMLLGNEIRDRFVQFQQRHGAGIPMPTATNWYMDRDQRPKWYWDAFSTNADAAQQNATRFQGFHPKEGCRGLVIFDEAAGILRPIWEAAETLMTDAYVHRLVIGNPTDSTGEFAACWRSPDWLCLSISAFDCPNLQNGVGARRKWGVTREWVDAMIRKHGEGSWPVETKVYGRFHTGGGDTLINAGELMAALKREPPVCVHAPEWIGIGCDVAQFGDDSMFIIAVCSGCNSILAVEERNGQELTATAGLVPVVARRLGMNEDHARQIAVDDTGLGGVCSMLRANGWGVQAIQFGAAPSRSRNDERVKDRRTEIWWNLREWVPRANLARLGAEWHDDMFGDLTLIKYAYRSDSVIQLEQKKDLKKRTGHSPDFGDALALAVSAIARRGSGGMDAPAPAPRLSTDDEEDARDDERNASRLSRKWGPLGDRVAGYGPGVAGSSGPGWTPVE